MFSGSNNLFRKYPQFHQYKPGIIFIARLFFIGLFFYILKKIYGWAADVNGIIDYPLLGPASPIEFLRKLLLESTKFCLTILGYPAFIHGWVVGIPHGGVRVETPCLGINICFAFIALVAAYPSTQKWHFKAGYILLGLIIIQLLNIARMVAMVFVVKNHYHLPIEHHDLFNLIIYTVIFLLFYYFIQISNRDRLTT